MRTAIYAETIGTFWLVFGGCGSAIVSAAYPTLGIGFAGVALAFGLTVLTMAYTVGPVSGGHFNPAVTVGLWAGGRFPAARVLPYVVAQIIGAVLAAIMLAIVASGKAGWTGSLASNGFGVHSPGGFSLASAVIIETVLTAIFLIVILGATDSRAPAGFAPIAIGLCLTLIHLVSIPVTNTSVNPARSTGPALIEAMQGNVIALQQLWVFWLAPLLGGVTGATLWRAVFAAEAA